MKTTLRLALLLAASCAAHTFGGDAKVTLNSTDGSSAFLVRDSASNELARVGSDGKVGIGIAAPAYTLDVLGDINLTGLFYTNGVPWNPLTSFTETDPAFAASAAAGIDAAKVSNWDAAYGWGDHALAGYLTAYTETDPAFAASVAAGIAADSTNSWNAKLEGSGTEGYLPKFTASGTVGDSALCSDSNGNIGIGTAAPGYKLTVQSGEMASVSDGTDGLVFTAADGIANKMAIRYDRANDRIEFRDNLNSETRVVVQQGGNVGIGTGTPAYKLDVAGAINGAAITINGTPVASSTDTYWSTAGGGAIQYSGGNVGVGTATPSASAALDVSATDKGILVPRLSLAQRDAVASPATGLLVYQTDNTPGFYFYNGTQWASVSAGGAVVSSVSASAPLASTGGSAPTLSMPAATASANGYLTSADFTLFNAKVPTNRLIATTAPLSGGGSLTNNLTISMPAASATTNGYLSGADWSAFNAKVPTNRLIATTTPLLGGGSLTNNLTLSIQTASASQAGALSAADWTTFNNKVSSGANSTITSLSGLTTDLSVAQGGTGASDAAGARANLGLGTAATLAAASANTASAVVQRDASGNFSAGTITATLLGTATNITGIVAVANGGTGSNTAPAARTALGAAASGANSDITSLSGLTTDLSVAQGGTGASTLTANKVLVGNGASAVLQPTNLHWDNTNSRLGVGDATPSYTVDVAGDINATGAVRVAGVSIATPAGVIQQFAGAAAPTGYLLCQGQAVSRTTYAALYAVLSTTYGAGDGSTTFNLPNLMGKIPVGYDSTQTEFNTRGKTGGAKTHTLTTAEIPAHNHAITDPGHTHTYDKTVSDSSGPFGDNSTEQKNLSSTSGKSYTGITINNTGDGGAHNNLQPYIVVNYIIKY